jgi:transposase
MAQKVLRVGIDVSKDRLDVYRDGDGAQLRVSNDPAGWRELTQWLRREPVAAIGLEPSGGYERGVLDALSAAGLPVSLVDAWRVRQFAGAIAQHAKTDPIDARVIARFLGVAALRAAAPDRARDELVQLLRARDALTAIAKRLTNLAEHTSDKTLLRTLATVAANHTRTQARLDRRIAALLAAHAPFAQRAALLTSVPGVGPVLAATLIARVPELGSLSRQRLASLIGLAPFPRDSGIRNAPRHIRRGRDNVRHVLYMATLGAVSRHNPRLKAVYLRLRANGKPPKVAIVACMRKLLTILNTMIATASPWRSTPA